MPEDDDNLSDDELFRSSMGDVRPLRSSERLSISKQKPQRKRQTTSDTLSNTSDYAFVEPDLDPVGTADALSFSAPGLQGRLLKQFKSGRLPFDGRLDLHGLNESQAEMLLRQRLQQHAESGSRCLLIIHGKGLHTDQRWPVLKNLVQRILRGSECVLAYTSAQPRDGGLGAVYVLLRRGEAHK